MIEDLKVYNNSFTPVLPFNESDFVHLEQTMTQGTFSDYLQQGKTIVLNKHKTNINNELSAYADSLLTDFASDPGVIAIINTQKNLTSKDVTQTIVDGKILIDEYLLLIETKEERIAEILTLFNEDEYSEDNYLRIKKLISDEINSLTSVEDVEGFDFELSELEEDLNNVLTTKDELKEELLALYDEDLYSEENYLIITTKINEEVDNLTFAEVLTYDFNESLIKDELDDLNTKYEELIEVS